MVNQWQEGFLMKDNLLIIFTRNPELGKVKTRLAAGIGNQKALEVYQFLLQHTVNISKDLNLTKEVHYSVKIRDKDMWSNDFYTKKQQLGNDLGERMMSAFANGFKNGFKNIIIIGSDMFDLDQSDLENAFERLESNDTIVGPAEDGGYYLLGLTKMIPELFQNKKWGTDSVLNDTLVNLVNEKYMLLEERNDIDTFDDLKQFDALKALINN